MRKIFKPHLCTSIKNQVKINQKIFTNQEKSDENLKNIPFDVKDELVHRQLLESTLEAGGHCVGVSIRPPEGAFPGCAGIGNPYNPKLTAGGSTSGGAVSVATGISCFSLGSDGGGSIRIPASFCGLYGLMYEKQLELKGKKDVDEHISRPGILTRNIDDMAFVLDSITSPKYNFSEFETPKQNIKVLIISEFNERNKIIPDFPDIKLEESSTLPFWNEFVFELLNQKNGSMRGPLIEYTDAKILDIKLPNITESFLIAWMEYFNKGWSIPSNLDKIDLDDTQLSSEEIMYKYFEQPIHDYGEKWNDMKMKSNEDISSARKYLIKLFKDYDFILTPALLTGPWNSKYTCPSFGTIQSNEKIPHKNMIDSRFNPYFVLTNIINNSTALCGPFNIDEYGIPVGYHLASITDHSNPGEITRKMLYIAKNYQDFINQNV